MISLANLSDNFQRMLHDPKNQQKKLEDIHQFVTTSHLLTSYIASISQYSKNKKNYTEIDIHSWQQKITAEMTRTCLYLSYDVSHDILKEQSGVEPDDLVDELVEKRKIELAENEFYDQRDATKISRLAELKNIQELFQLMYNVAKDQRKIAKRLHYETV